VPGPGLPIRQPTYRVAIVRQQSQRTVAIVLSACALLVVAGCGEVRLFEQHRLNRPDMRFDADPLQYELREHIHAAREGAVGGFSGAGAGGCGCN
jgi:hypothetical protein